MHMELSLLRMNFVPSDGPTNIADALRVVRSDLFSVANGDRPTVADVVVIVSDGQTTVQTNLTAELADVARQHGIEIYFVTVGSDVNFKLINTVVSIPTESHVITGLVTSSDVVSTAARLANKLCLLTRR
jgi:Mg-chelatase subunit ChlD